MTIDARSAIASGDRVEQRALDREPRAEVARERGSGRHQPAEVHDAPQAGAGGSLRERGGGAPLGVGEGARGRALHRVDQVVRDVDALERALQARAGRDVAEHEVGSSTRAAATRSARACEAAHRVAVALQSLHERRADVPGHARDEGLHRIEGTRGRQLPEHAGSPSR